ncbi:MAG: hypothetical protein FWH18_11190 [Marinilabiliaceae bacterium]|nr:hypothetical protein [Marinilabiliaceae bacterium]
MKKGIFIGIFGLILLIGVVFWFIYDNISYQETSLISTIPVSSEIVIQLHHPEQFGNIINSVDFLDELNNFESFKPFKELAFFLDSSFISNTNSFNKIKKRPIIISLIRNENEPVSWLISGSLKSKQEQKEITKIIKDKWKNAPKEKVAEEFCYLLKQNTFISSDIYISYCKGSLTISNSATYLKESLQQRKIQHSLLERQSFYQIFKNAPGTDFATIYINFAKIGKILSPLFSENGAFVSDFFTRFGEWCGLDLAVKDVITLNGFNIGRNEKFFTTIFAGLTPQKSNIPTIIPLETKFFITYNFNEKVIFKDNYETYISQNETDLDNLLGTFEKTNGISFSDLLFSFVKNEMALVYTKQPKENEYDKYLVISTEGQTKTVETLQQYIYKSEKNIDPDDFITLDDQTKIPVYKGFSTSEMKAFLNFLFPTVPCEFFSFYRNYIIFSEDIESLKSFFYSAILNKNLSSYPYFPLFEENFSFHDNFFLFAEVPEIYNLIKEFLNPEIFYPTQTQNEALNNFYGLGVQMSTSGNFVYSTIAVNHAPFREDGPKTIWQSRLDSTIIGKPAFVENHNTGEKDILVQDAAFNLYLINNLGRILWKKPLEAPIMSEFFQIDHFGNGKMQYLFNTNNRIYLIDQNGNNVGTFPVVLPENATNGISVFDYDKNKDYRIFIALENNQVSLYDKKGNIIPGWAILQTEGKVTLPVQFFTTGNKDYIVVSDEFGNYILDRRGAERVKVKTVFIRNSRSLFYLEEVGDNSLLVTTTDKGELAKINLKTGACTISALLQQPDNHFFAQYKNESGNLRYITVTENNFCIYNNKCAEEINIQFDTPLELHSDIYRFSASDIKFGVVEKNGGMIHLLNHDGQHYKGFPLKGKSRFTIGFLKATSYKFNLIVGGDNNFLNNFAVE